MAEGKTSYSKSLKSITAFTAEPKKSVKFCITCANIATQEACFDVGDGVSVIEKYCDVCVKKIKK